MKLENLTFIKLPEYISFIPEKAFLGCKSLKEIVVPKNIEEIKSHAFEECLNLQHVVVLNDNIKIADECFVYKKIRKSNTHKIYPKYTLNGTPDHRYNPIYEVKTKYVETFRNIAGIILIGELHSATDIYAKSHGFQFAALR